MNEIKRSNNELSLVITLTLIFAFNAFGQTDYNQQMFDQDKAMIISLTNRSANEDLAESRKAWRERRYKIIKPLQFTIKVQTGNVMTWLIDSLKSKGYSVERESVRRLTFSRPLKGFKEDTKVQLVKGIQDSNEPRLSMSVTVDEISGGGLNKVGDADSVIINARFLTNNISFQSEKADFKMKEKMRNDVESILSKIKKQAEKK